MNSNIAKEKLWRRGILSWKLDKVQQELYELFYNKDFKTQTWVLARRSGKSYALCVLAIEQCLKKSNSVVKFVSPTKIQVDTNIRPIMRTILEDCPQDLRPEYRKKDYIYYFPNGSEIQLAGTDSGHAEKLRGTDSHLWIVDEAGSCDNLDSVVKSILLPTTLITKGKGILASTPPKEGTHDFIKFVEEAEMRGSLIKKTVYDNPRITKEQLEELINELGGLTSDAARRELLCEFIKESSTSVLPAVNAELLKEIVKEWPKPPFYDAYEAMDLGFTDLTVVLFGYYDYRAAKLIIEDEIVMKGEDMQLPTLVKDIKNKELALWTHPMTLEPKKPALRVSDINYIVTNEMSRASNNEINFAPAKKDDNDAALNNLNLMLASKKIIINPKCVTLIRHLLNVKWYSPNNKTKFARSPDDGHYDAVEACKYMVRHVQYNKNPYPSHYDLNMTDVFVPNPDRFRNSGTLHDAFNKILGRKKSESQPNVTTPLKYLNPKINKRGNY